MALPRRSTLIASSVILIIVIAITLTTSIELRVEPGKMIQIDMAQGAKAGQSDLEALRKGNAGGKINGTDFDRADILNGTSTIGEQNHGSTLYISGTATRWATPTATNSEGFVGETPTPQPMPSHQEGFIGLKTTSKPAIPAPTPRPPPGAQLPILAFSYAGSGGPKHCRGELIQKLEIPPPASAWAKGTCVDLPAQARCGVFFAGKEAGCEAQLFNMPGCMNTTRTYVNTVVFMPEERTVGALWTSMYIRCGVEAPEAGLIDPAILGGLLKPKPGKGG